MASGTVRMSEKRIAASSGKRASGCSVTSQASSGVFASAKAPLLVLHGDEDTIIRPHHSDRVASLWGGPVERATLEGFGHNDLQVHPGYAAAIRAFLDRHL